MDVGLNKQIVLLIRALYFSMCEEWADISKEHHLSSAQQHLLYILSSSDVPLTVTEISQFGCWHISTVTRLLQPLNHAHYISITNGKGKYKYVELTELGKQKLKLILEDFLHRNHFPLNFAGIETEALSVFVQIGLQVLSNQKGEDFTQWVQVSNAKTIGMTLDAMS